MRAQRVFKCFSFTYTLRKHLKSTWKHLLASTPRLIFALLCAFTNKLIRLFFMREIEFCYLMFKWVWRCFTENIKMLKCSLQVYIYIHSAHTSSLMAGICWLSTSFVHFLKHFICFIGTNSSTFVFYAKTKAKTHSPPHNAKQCSIIYLSGC